MKSSSTRISLLQTYSSFDQNPESIFESLKEQTERRRTARFFIGKREVGRTFSSLKGKGKKDFFRTLKTKEVLEKKYIKKLYKREQAVRQVPRKRRSKKAFKINPRDFVSFRIGPGLDRLVQGKPSVRAKPDGLN